MAQRATSLGPKPSLFFSLLSFLCLNRKALFLPNENAEKRTLGQEQLAQVCSQIVSFFFFVFL